MKLLSLIILFVSVCSSGTDFTSSNLKPFVEEYIKSTFTDSTTEVLIEFRNIPADITVPSDDYRLKVADESGRTYRGNVSLPVEIISDGKVYRKLIVSVKVRTFENVIVSTSFINRNESILNAKVTTKKIETTSLPVGLIREAAQLNGMRSRRIINEGSVLYENWFESEPVVKRNDMLDMIVSAKSVKVTTQVVAKEDGRIKDVVTVEEMNSKKKHRATVLDSRRVEINLD